MTGKTAIEWATHTWNPVTGCTRVSDGCDHCYAFQLHDQRHLAWKRGDLISAPAQYHLPFSTVQTLPDRLRDPLRWTRPRKVFVNSMGDLFHKEVDDKYIARVFAVMTVAHTHTFQVLTKRPERMAALCSDPEWIELVAYYASVHYDPNEKSPAVRALPTFPWPAPNIWLGTSVEHQQAADERIPHLLRTPAAVRFLSCEPLLGPVDLSDFLRVVQCPRCNTPVWKSVETPEAWCSDCCVAEVNAAAFGGSIEHHGHFPVQGNRAIHWVIVGGESGKHARPMHPAWARSLRDQCVAAGVPFFFKQWGEWLGADIETDTRMPGRYATFGLQTISLDRSTMATDLGDGTAITRVGKKAAGRELDGRTWDEAPATGGA